MGTNFPKEIDNFQIPRTISAQKSAYSRRKMNFPIKVQHRRSEAVIYGKSKTYPYYRLAYRFAGKRIVRSFRTYAAARKEADKKVREIDSGKMTAALSTKEAAQALSIREALDEHRRTTGQSFTATQAVTSFLDAMKLLPAGQNLSDVVRGYLETAAVIERKPLAESVREFNEARKAKTMAKAGKRPALNPIYVADTARQLNKFADTFTGTAVADLAKSHIDAFIGAHSNLTPKSRNHLRSTVRMFLAWSVRRDYLPANHRLLESDSLQKEPLDNAPIDYYRPEELKSLLERSSGSMRAIIALQALGGLRLQEALRLDWSEVFGIKGHIEVSSSKSKTRQRRLVETCPALENWLAPFRGSNGQVTDQSLNGYTAAFIALRKKLEIPPRRNGLRHGFVTYHFALHGNENQTAAQAGNSPAMIHGHYKGLATKSEAEKWFGVCPKEILDNSLVMNKKSRKNNAGK